MEFDDHLWLQFIDQPQLDVVFFEIIYFCIYKHIVIEWKHKICPNDIIIFNENLEKYQQKIYN